MCDICQKAIHIVSAYCVSGQFYSNEEVCLLHDRNKYLWLLHVSFSRGRCNCSTVSFSYADVGHYGRTLLEASVAGLFRKARGYSPQKDHPCVFSVTYWCVTKTGPNSIVSKRTIFFIPHNVVGSLGTPFHCQMGHLQSLKWPPLNAWPVN